MSVRLPSPYLDFELVRFERRHLDRRRGARAVERHDVDKVVAREDDLLRMPATPTYAVDDTL